MDTMPSLVHLEPLLLVLLDTGNSNSCFMTFQMKIPVSPARSYELLTCFQINSGTVDKRNQ